MIECVNKNYVALKEDKYKIICEKLQKMLKPFLNTKMLNTKME